VEGKKFRVYLFGKIEEKVNGRKWRMGENKFRVLEKNSPFLHFSLFFPRSPLFKPLNSYLFSIL